ncbi:hypothetical protein [Singulisphaera sp. PoT]|uniref:hypothetical protein n=1 Tax=Singulisphaera sp. PoT TaxID=3411797 RepID=UPI003BF4E130
MVRTPVNAGQPVTDAGVVPVERRFANRTMRSPNEIRQHARNAFAASDRLLRQAADDPSVERFYRAANRYIATLKTLSEPAFRAGESGDVVPTAPNPADIISIGLINHGVKEALDALALKQLVLLMKADTPEGRTLLDHAQKMDAESRQAIDSVDRLEAVTDLNPAGRALPAGNQLGVVVTNTGGSNGAGVRMLADQSRELLQTIRELGRGTTVERQR